MPLSYALHATEARQDAGALCAIAYRIRRVLTSLAAFRGLRVIYLLLPVSAKTALE